MLSKKTTYTEIPHYLDTPILLNSEFDSVESPVAFRDLQLYPHQKTVVAALLDIENKRVILVKSYDYTHVTAKKIFIETSAAVLSEPFGSGKTAEILALILIQPIPRAVPSHVNSVFLVAQGTRHSGNSDGKFQHEIVKRFTQKNSLIRPNLIVVGSSVVLQWENYIKTHTHLKCFTIGGYYELRQFYNLFVSGKINCYDIVLLKNGKVTGNFEFLRDENLESLEYYGLINVIYIITKQFCWSRVIYDDYDTIHIPTNSIAINALFTIYVSATTRESEYHPSHKRIQYNSIISAIQNNQLNITKITKDTALYSNFSVKNTPELVEISTRIPIIEAKRYVYDNPADNYIQLIGVMGDAAIIMEMLNGDAIETAAITLGIKTNSVADIFQKLLDDKYKKFLYDQDILELIANIRTAILPNFNHSDNDEQYTVAELDNIRTSILKKTMPILKYRSIALERLLAELHNEYISMKEQDGAAISRVMSNIKEGECQVCRLPLTDFDAFIVKCCGIIVCDRCGIKGNQIQNRYDKKFKINTIYGSCANCKTIIYPQKDLIFVDKNFDIESLLKAKGDEKPAEELDAPAGVKTGNEDEIKNPKLRALLKIINGEVPQNGEDITLKIKNLLNGRVNIPSDKTAKPRVLIFANFNETLNMIVDLLTKQGIDFLRLHGTYQDKADIVEKFKTTCNVLVVDANHNCAGLCLEHASDLVFFHKIIDPNVESQVAGRVQRIGRKDNARIHYLLYRNEARLI